MEIEFRQVASPGAKVEEIEAGHWRLSLPAGETGTYRIAQLDDYAKLKRRDFTWQVPFTLRLQARASTKDLPGTWGFGLWNDPFSFSLGLSGTGRRLPALPNTAWFFFASPPNYLSFRDDLPAVGQLAATFRSPLIPPLLLGLGVPFLPLLAWKPTARLLRKMTRKIIQQSVEQLSHDPTQWHTYKLNWLKDRVVMKVNDEQVLTSPITPKGRLGIVLWIDNQFAALPPDGKLGFGTLENPASWIEIKDLEINPK